MSLSARLINIRIFPKNEIRKNPGYPEIQKNSENQKKKLSKIQLNPVKRAK